MNRVLKQIFYGLFYIMVFSGVIWIGYSVSIAPAPSCTDGKQNQQEEGIDCGGPCTACDVINLTELERVGSPQLFSLNEQHSALFTISNRNTSHNGRYNYRIAFLSSGGALVDEVYGSSYVFASDRDYIHRTISRSFSSAEFEILDTEWIEDGAIEKPVIEDVSLSFSGDSIEITGVVSNSSEEQFSSVRVIALFKDSLGFNTLFSAQAVVENISPLEDKSFSYSVPISQSVRERVVLEETELLLGVND